MVVSIAIAVIGLLLVIGTFVDVFEGRVPARTIWGVLVIVAGILSPVFTGLLVVCKRRFACWHRSWQFLALIVVPCAYLLVLAGFMLRALQSSITVVPLPFTPTLCIGLHDDGIPALDIERLQFHEKTILEDPYTAFMGRVHTFQGSWGASNRASWPFFRLRRRREYLPHVEQSIVDLTGMIGSRGAYGVDIVMGLAVTQTIQLRVDGLYDVDITCDGRDVFDPAKVHPGQHRIAITGRPTPGLPQPHGGPEAAVAQIKTLGGEVKVDASGAWDVDLTSVQLTDPGMEHLLIELTKLKRLSLSLALAEDSDRSLEHLRRTTNLRELNLRELNYLDGVHHLFACTGRHKIPCPPVSVGNEVSQFIDAGLEHLQGLTGLETLSLWRTHITDAGLEHLEGLTKLQTLRLCETQLTDAGLKHLSGLANLQTLCLYHTQVTDAGLEHLEGMTSLRSLDLHLTQVTDEGVKEFQRALPNCKLYH